MVLGKAASNSMSMLLVCLFLFHVGAVYPKLNAILAD